MTTFQYMKVNEDYILYIDGDVYPVKPDHYSYGHIRRIVDALDPVEAVDPDVLDRQVAKVVRFFNMREAIQGAVEADFRIAGLSIQVFTSGTVAIEGDKLPSSLEKAVYERYKEKKSMGDLINFWRRLGANPVEHIREQLFAFLSTDTFPLLPDGRFMAYKGVFATDDPDKFAAAHGHGYNNFYYTLGEKTRLRHDECNLNPHEACSRGLHAGTRRYAKDYGDTLMEVIIDPRDVIAVPHADAAKIRCCALTVHQASPHHEQSTIYTGPIPEDPDEFEPNEVEGAKHEQHSFLVDDQTVPAPAPEKSDEEVEKEAAVELVNTVSAAAQKKFDKKKAKEVKKATKALKKAAKKAAKSYDRTYYRRLPDGTIERKRFKGRPEDPAWVDRPSRLPKA